jgi:hypothetical protein
MIKTFVVVGCATAATVTGSRGWRGLCFCSLLSFRREVLFAGVPLLPLLVVYHHLDAISTSKNEFCKNYQCT